MDAMLESLFAIVVMLFAIGAGAAKMVKKSSGQQPPAERQQTPVRPQPMQQVPGQVHMSYVLPNTKPPQTQYSSASPAQTQRSASSAQTQYSAVKAAAPVQREGVEFHPPGFHGAGLVREELERVDLGAIRAQENRHTAANAQWKPPETLQNEHRTTKDTTSPMFTAQQMKSAFIMQEILNEPVSRRRGSRRAYGR